MTTAYHHLLAGDEVAAQLVKVDCRLEGPGRRREDVPDFYRKRAAPLAEEMPP